MTNAKTTKRALLSSIVSLILCFTMLLSTTYAWFTDTVVSANNIITAGNLDIELYHTNDDDEGEKVNEGTILFDDVKLWEPGAVAYETFKIVNEGNLALKYQFAVNISNATKNEKGNTLADVLKIGVIDGAVSSTERTDLIKAVTTWQDFASFTKSGKLVETDETVDTDTTDTYTVVIYWEPSENDNEYNVDENNPLKIDIGVALYATQLNSEKDSFNEDYDEDAWVEGFKVYSAQDLQAAINNGKTEIQIMDDMKLEEPIVIPAPVATTYSARSNAVVIDLNGKTITGNVGRDAEGNRVHVVVNNGNAVIKNGTVTSAGVNGGSAIYNAEGATLTVEDVILNGAPQEGSTWPSYTVNNYGTLTVSDSSIYGVQGIIATNNTANTTVNNVIAYRDGWSSGHVFYTSSTAKVTINGGTYTNDGNGVDGTMIYGGETVVNGGTFIVKEGAYFALCSGSKLTVNGGDFSNIKSCIAWGGTMTVSGGTFGFDPSAYVAAGYEAVDNSDGTYKVVMAAGTLENLFTNIEDGGTVTLPQGSYTIPSTVAGKNVTIEGIGDNTVIDFTKVNAVGDASITFKNLHIQGKNENIMSGFGIQSTTGHITYENCTFDGAVTNEYYGSVSYINCTFTGTGYITTYAVKSAEFVNCTFDKADSRAVLVYSHGNNPCKVTLTNCTFKAAAKATTWAGDWTAAVEVDTTNIPSTGTSVSINNCTYDANYSGIVRDKSAAGKANAVITLDGMIVLTPSNINTVDALVEAGATKVMLMDGNYTMPEINLQGKTLTISGTKDTIIDVSTVDARNQFVTGATLVFDGVTLNFGKANYMGFANTASLTYKNCQINGLQFLFGAQVNFENCDLNSNGAEHCVWTYGAQNVNFVDCDFTYGDRGINCYSDNDVTGGKQTVNFTDCTFATENTASEGAVEINSCFFSVGIEVNMEGCTAPAYGEMAYVSQWDSTNGAKTTINIK